MREGHVAEFGLTPTQRIDLELDPGDVAFSHLHAIHSSGANTSAIDRRLYLNGYVTAANCDRGEWAFRGGKTCRLGEPVLVPYEDLHARPEPHYVENIRSGAVRTAISIHRSLEDREQIHDEDTQKESDSFMSSW